MNPPKRAIEVKIVIGGDTADDVKSALDQIAFAFDEPQGIREIVSGAPSAGWRTEVERNPGQTNEKYMAELDSYLAFQKQKDKPAGGRA